MFHKIFRFVFGPDSSLFKRKGTTLVEMLISVAIIAVFSLLVFLSLLGKKSQNNLNATADSMAALLRDARSRSVSQSSSTGWGVHFENSTTKTPFYALFFSANYSSTSTVGYYTLPAGVGYVPSSIAQGSSKDITFAQLTGFASTSSSVAIYLLTNPGSSSTISVASSGAVSY